MPADFTLPDRLSSPIQGTTTSFRIILRGGKLELGLKGRKLRGGFVLTQLKGKGRKWLIIKKNDEYTQPNSEIKPELMGEERGYLSAIEPPCNAEQKKVRGG